MSLGGRLKGTKEVTCSIVIIITGVLLLVTASVTAQQNGSVVGITALGGALFFIGTLSLITGVLELRRKQIRKANDHRSAISVCSRSQVHISEEDIQNSNAFKGQNVNNRLSNQKSQLQFENVFVNLSTCPKVIIPVRIQPLSYGAVTTYK